MAIGRSRYAPPYMSTKGHSVLKQRSYSSPRSAPTTTGFSRASAYDTRAEERFLTDRVSNVNFLSNSLMDEGYDTAVKSRGRDQQLLKEATNAIVSAESYATPQTSVASRRVARGQSVTPRAASVPPRSLKPQVGSYYTRYSSSSRRTEDDDDEEPPKSILSWKYRLDSMVNPKDVIYEPSSLIRLKQRVKNAQAKMSEHREMLDKYLPEGDPDAADVATSIRRKMAAMDRRNPRVERRAREVEEEEENPVEEEPLRATSEE